jgi:hypothetical protein
MSKKTFEVAFTATYIVTIEAENEDEAVAVFDGMIDPKKNAEQIGNYAIDYIESEDEDGNLQSSFY